ncbi:hypothetical protein [Vulgatibacter sp.]|uniref:hypothetical protein n=1 Tax=Vulgatibacter sp. TaxID=1971226 RepID=UPI0035689A8F
MRSKHGGALLAALVVGTVGCADDAPKRVRGGGAGGSGGGGGQERPAGPELGAREQLGTFLESQPRAVLVGAEKPLLIMATSAVAFDPAFFGKVARTEEAVALSAGLLVVDTSTGTARVLDEKDGLPAMQYGDPAQPFEAVASIFDLDWVTVDQRFVAAGYESLIAGSVAADGALTFQHAKLRAEGKSADAVVFQTAVLGDLVFAGGDQGLAIAAAENLAVQRWVDFGTPDRTIHALHAGSIGGEGVVAVLHGAPDAPAADAIGVAKADGTFEAIDPPEGFLPISTLLVDGRAFFGFVTPDKAGAIYEATRDDRGWSLELAAGPMELVTDGKRHPVVPGLLAYDPDQRAILVGGRIVEGAPGGPGGGFVALPYSEEAGIRARATDVVTKNDPYFAELPWQFDAIVPDGKGGVYLAGRQLCNEHKMRQLPLFHLRRAAGVTELVRPWIDGVRSISVDPVNGETWLGLRNEVTGLSCEGLAVGQSLCRLRADGACVITTPRVNADENLFAATPGASAVAFGDPDRNQIAVATLRDALFVQDGALSHAIPSQINPGLNLNLSGAAFEGEELWVSSPIEYDEMHDEKVNDRGPHGVGIFSLGDEAPPKAQRRYVRNESDIQEELDVPGLPSNMAYDVLPLGKGRALIALGIERVYVTHDHILPAPAKSAAAGGIALVDGEKVEIIAPPAGVALEEVVALARGGDGTLYALDAWEGIFTIDVETKKAKRWSTATWEATEPFAERALSLAVDADGHLAVGTTHGLHVFGADTGVTRPLADMESGYVWSVEFVQPGVLYAGTDEGMHRIAVGDRQLPAKGPASLERWPFPLEVEICGPAGECACVQDSQCATGSDCQCGDFGKGFECLCTPADACVAEPGALDCACDPTAADPCVYDLACTTDDAGQSTCQLPGPPPCEGTEGCPCSAEGECAEGFECNFMFGLCQAVPA